MAREEKWLELKKRLKNAVFLETVFWIFFILIALSVSYAVFYNAYIKPNLYTIHFSDIDGLIEGSPVRFMGIVVGHVRKLDYQKDSIKVEIIVTKKNTTIPSGSIASVEFSGIAGSKSIEIRPPEDDLSDIGIIAKETLRLKDLFEAYKYIGKAFASLKDFVDNINQDNVLKIFGAVNSVGRDFNKIDETLEKGNQRYRELDKKSKEMVESTRKLEDTLDKMNDNAKKIGSYLKK